MMMRWGLWLALACMCCGAVGCTETDSTDEQEAGERADDPMEGEAPDGGAETPDDEAAADDAGEPDPDDDGSGGGGDGDMGPDCYAVVFEGGFNGRIEGEAEQCVAPGAMGTPVEAIPRSGFTFTAWSDGSTENPRTLSDPQASETLTAQFETAGLTTVWLGHSFIRWNVELLYDVARQDAGYAEHADWMTFAGGGGGAPGSLWDDPGRRELGQRMIREQRPDNVVMTIYPRPGSSDYEDYANWIDYTLDHAPDARFYISIPWRNRPFGNADIDPILWEDGAEDIEALYINEVSPPFAEGILNRLRENYPENEFVVIPQAIAADRIVKAHFGGTLTTDEGDGSLFVLNPKTGETHEHERSIFDDTTGHPGGPLRLLTMTLYLRYIYGVEVSAFDFWEENQSFRNVGLEGIGPKESFDVPYTFYNGFDFPAVADDIFRTFGRGG